MSRSRSNLSVVEWVCCHITAWSFNFWKGVMPRAGEGGDEAVGQEGVGKANVEPEEVAPWEMVTRDALTEVDAEKRVEEVALHSTERCCSELEDAWLYEEETWLEVVRVDVPDADRWV